MSLPRTQALLSRTFTIPPLDDTVSLPGLYDWHYEHSRDHPLFVFEDEPNALRTIRYREAGQAINRASQYASNVLSLHPDISHEEPPVVAVLAMSDTVTYFCFIVGILRLGWTIFPISPRNSPVAIAALLSQTNSKHLFLSSDPVIHDLARESLEIMPKGSQPQSHDMPVFEDLFPIIGPDPAFHFVPMPTIDMDAPAIILHSSGTTAYPTPVTWTHRSWIRFARHPYRGEMDLTGVLLACHAVPMFHGMGIVQVNYAASCGLVVSMFKPRTPATIPDPINTLYGALVTKSDLVAVVPAFVEAWSRNKQHVAALAKMTGIIYGGGPLSKEVGDYMFSNGVKLFANYASTQVGVLSVFLPKQPEDDWEYFRFSPNREVHMIPDGHGAAEAVVVATPEFTPRKINTKIDGRDAYATSDLLVAHPTKQGLWTVYGRTDDQIMHSTGEKTNPGPLENILNRDPHIKAAVIFGRGQFHAGVIVQPSEPFIFDPADVQKLAAFRNLIWPSVQAANDYAPSHSRIFKEMILVASLGKPFTYTPKGTARRLVIIADYEAEIAALYRAAAESSQEDLGGPVDWTYPSVLIFVRTIVHKTLARTGSISDDVDLFNVGCDSLQATWIRNTVFQALRKEYPHVVRGLSSNLVFDHPTISAMSLCISSSVSSYRESAGGRRANTAAENGNVNETSSAQVSKIAGLQMLVDKYTDGLPNASSHSLGEMHADGEVILLTGSTGSFGSSILARLITSPTVKRIFALARRLNALNEQNAKSSSVYERHVAAFTRSGLDISLLRSLKVTFLDGDLTRPDFGIALGLLLEVKSSLTHIIHNAWRVDFKLSVSSMEPMIVGVRNLIDLALSCASERQSHPKFVFVSSVGVVRHAKYVVPEVGFPSPDLALGSGYSESKWVAERILDNASRRTPLKSTIIRLGQLTGGPGGAWNESEWFPSLVKSSIFLKCLPDADGEVSWLSCLDAASVLLDLLQFEQHEQIAYFHLVNPRPVPWSSMIAHFSEALQLKVVPYKEWFALLRKMHEKLQGNHTSSDRAVRELNEIPALRLIEFFQEAANRSFDPSTEPLGVPRLDCRKALKISRTLQDTGISTIGPEAVDKWLRGWTSSGFLEESS